jgi:hypothetical protein
MAAPPSNADRSLDPAQGYQIFEALFGRVEHRVVAAAPALLGYPREAVGRRLVQRIVEFTLYPLIKTAAESHARGVSPIPPGAQTLQLGGLRFCGDRVTLTPKTWARCFGAFCVQWVRVIGYLAGSGRKTIPERTTLLMGVGLSYLGVDGSDMRFIAFCERGPLTPLRVATRIAVENSQPFASSKPCWVSYSRQPLLALLRAHPPRGLCLLRFVGTHLVAAASFAWHSFTHPLSCLLARDMAFHAPAVDLNRRGLLEAVVITASYFQVQPLWMRSLPGCRFKVHMAWHSQNTKPFVYKLNGFRTDMPLFRHIAVDAHWVWTEGYAAHLRRLGTTAEVHVVGPILWYLPEASPPAAPAPSVAIFDITPVKEAFAQQIGLPRNYYSTANMIAFLERAIIGCEHVAAQLGQSVSVLLKHKRSHAEIHDPRYIEVVDQLVAAGRIRLLPPQTSLYSLIAESAAIVVVPFSSPAYVASDLEVPAIYFDATDSIEDTHEPAPFVDFASGEAALAEKLYPLLRAHGQEAQHA